MASLEMFAALLIAHALCDYPLQGDFLARAKNVTNPIDGVPWWCAMAAHAAIQAGGVWCCTGSSWLGLSEFVMHWIIDFGKCRGFFSFAVDQLLHCACKALWVAVVVIQSGVTHG